MHPRIHDSVSEWRMFGERWNDDISRLISYFSPFVERGRQDQSCQSQVVRQELKADIRQSCPDFNIGSAAEKRRPIAKLLCLRDFRQAKLSFL